MVRALRGRSSVFFIPLTFMILLLVGLKVRADGQLPPPVCPERHELYGNTKADELPSRDGRCTIMITPNDTDGTYRSYTVSSTGLFMAFTSFAGNQDGSRSYFLFPRAGAPSFEVLASGETSVRTVSGRNIRISPNHTRLTAIDDVDFTEAPDVSMSNHGGVELTAVRPGLLLLDCGWRKGGVAYSSLDSTSVFRDGAGKTCSVKNRDLFVKRNGEVYLKHEKDAELADFLAVRCPSLDVRALREPIPSETVRPEPSPEPSEAPSPIPGSENHE